MTTKQWLMRARNIDREITVLLKAYEETKDRLTKVTQTISGDIVQHEKDPHKFDRLAELGEKIDSKVDELVDVRNEIYDTISKVESQQQRELLVRRYITGETFEQIAVNMKYSYKQICRIHGRALITIGGMIDVLSL